MSRGVAAKAAETNVARVRSAGSVCACAHRAEAGATVAVVGSGAAKIAIALKSTKPVAARMARTCPIPHLTRHSRIRVRDTTVMSTIVRRSMKLQCQECKRVESAANAATCIKVRAEFSVRRRLERGLG